MKLEANEVASWRSHLKDEFRLLLVEGINLDVSISHVGKSSPLVSLAGDVLRDVAANAILSLSGDAIVHQPEASGRVKRHAWVALGILLRHI